MVFGKRVILTSFAGRRDRMELLVLFAREAIGRGLIDEWHIWDFTRVDSDRVWINDMFPNIRRTPDRLDYRRVGAIIPDIRGWTSFEARVRCKSNFLIRLVPDDGGDDWYEIVLGGWDNTRSVIRRIRPAGRDEDVAVEMITNLVDVTSVGLTSQRAFKSVKVSYDGCDLLVSVNDVVIMGLAIDFGNRGRSVLISTGHGADGEVLLADVKQAREMLFISRRIGGAGFGEFYNFYADRYDEYRDAVILKCDDDILFFDLDRLSAFIRFRLEHPEFFVVSANVINNGICAYYQQREGLIPAELMELELPPGGFGGRLWQNPGWAETLHEHFLSNSNKFLRACYRNPVITWEQRFSINFISWLGVDLQEMGCAYGDDEQYLSVEIPSRLGRTSAIFMDFVACHLSFFTQDPHMERAKIIAAYRDFAQTTYRLQNDSSRTLEN